MCNVVMLNFAYDVPVKLFSIHLLSMAIFIIVPDVKRLSNLFLFNRVVEPDASQVFLYGMLKPNGIIIIAKGAIMVLFLAIAFGAVRGYLASNTRNITKPKQINPLVGQFEVESFILNGKVVPPGELDTRRWKKISMNPKTVDIQYMDGGSGPWHCQ